MEVSKAPASRNECTYGLLADVVECVGCCVNNLTLDLVGPASVVPQATSGSGNVNVLGHGESLAIVESLDSGKEVDVLQEEVGKLNEKLSAVLRCLLPPWTVEGLAGGLDSDIDILLGRLLDGCDDLFCGRVDDLEGLAVNGLDKLVVDEAVPRVRSWRKQWSPEDRKPIVPTYRPVGWSYSPVWGVLSFTETSDMIVIANWVSEKTKCE
jgi:hypothetical protein